MAYRHRLVLALSVLLTGLPLTAEAAQIAPNPNPIGSTINVTDPAAVNDLNPFENLGTINLGTTSTIGTLTNNGTLNSSGALTGIGTLINNGILTSTGTIELDAGGITNYGTFTNNSSFARVDVVNHGTLTNNDHIGGHSVENHGTLTNTGVMSWASYQNHGQLTNSGAMGGPGSVFNRAGATLVNLAGGTISYGTLSFNEGTIVNSGTMGTGEGVWKTEAR